MPLLSERQFLFDEEHGASRTMSQILRWLDALFERQPRNNVLAASMLMSFAIGGVDYIARGDLLILYLAPVFIAAWYGGSRTGGVVAMYCAAAWFISEAVKAGSEGTSPAAVWTLLARLIMFLVITKIVSKLRETMRQQVELSQFIVHDLRSPLASAITGLMSLEQMQTNLNDVEKEMVALALVSNQRALELVNSILDVSKLETGKMAIQREKVELASFLDDCFEQVALWAKGNGVEVRRTASGDAAYFDRALTARVLVNLLGNALKFSPPGSVVLLTAHSVGHEPIRFTVEDEGPGIPPDFVETIFEPFAQVAGTKGGTGLGLTFCRLAVHAQGGKIWVESALGKGTHMIFTLPYVAPASISSPHRATAFDSEA